MGSLGFAYKISFCPRRFLKKFKIVINGNIKMFHIFTRPQFYFSTSTLLNYRYKLEPADKTIEGWKRRIPFGKSILLALKSVTKNCYWTGNKVAVTASNGENFSHPNQLICLAEAKHVNLRKSKLKTCSQFSSCTPLERVSSWIKPYGQWSSLTWFGTQNTPC